MPQFRYRPFVLMGIAAALGLALALGVGTPAHAQGFYGNARVESGGDSSGKIVSAPAVLPAEFVGNRIYLRVPLASGDTLRFFTDTGGGPRPVLMVQTARRLDLPVDSTRSKRFGKTPLPAFYARTPVPIPDPDTALVSLNRQINRYLGGDGLLGGRWHDGRVWTFDYPSEKLLLHGSAEEMSFGPEHTAELVFATDSTGRRVGHHPMVQAKVADSTRSFLFDTGATTMLTDSARTAVGGPRRRGTGFISASLFNRWRRAHPEWTVLENGSVFGGGAPMIQVPEVTIAGHTVGPVWFERRPDRNFQRMAQRTGQPVRGALGGSLFQYFRITVDYPEARAHFEKAL